MKRLARSVLLTGAVAVGVVGKDVFAVAISKAFAEICYQIAYANDLTSVHVSEGEIHCATNTLRDSGQRWWTKAS